MRLLKYFLLLIILFSSISLYSQEQKTVYKILGISVIGNKSSDANTIIASTGLKVGNEIQVPGDKMINAIKNLWALNIFSDIQILIDKQLSDGVFLLIKGLKKLLLKGTMRLALMISKKR
jgi:outer membrane protein insertion porin family